MRYAWSTLIDGSRFGCYGCQKLESIFSNLPPEVTDLDLTGHDLFLKSGPELQRVFSFIPFGVTTLNLSGNQLGRKSGPELKIAFSGIPAGVKDLHLNGTELGGKSGTELKIAFSGIPMGVKALDLWGNELFQQSGFDLKEAFSGIPAGVTSLGLGYNELYKKTEAELKQAFSGIPAGVVALDLSNNDFGDKSNQWLITMLQGLPNTVAELDLSENRLFHKSGPELVELLHNIPSHVRTIRLNNNRLFAAAKLNKDTDEYFQSLMNANPERNIELGGNGYSVFSRIIVVFFAKLMQWGPPSFINGHSTVYKHIMSFLLPPTTHAQSPLQPFSQWNVKVMDDYLKSNRIIFPCLTKRLIKVFLAESDLSMLEQASDYIRTKTSYPSSYQLSINLLIFLKLLQERVVLTGLKSEEIFHRALDVMKTHIIKALDNQDTATTDNQIAQANFNAAYRTAIAMSQRHLRVAVDVREAEEALQSLNILQKTDAKKYPSSIGFFSRTAIDTREEALLLDAAFLTGNSL